MIGSPSRGRRVPRTVPGESWPTRVDEHLADGVSGERVDRWVLVGVRGRAIDRVNHGRLDPKDLFGWQANAAPDRLTAPLIRESGRLVQTDWDTALGLVAQRSKELLE